MRSLYVHTPDHLLIMTILAKPRVYLKIFDNKPAQRVHTVCTSLREGPSQTLLLFAIHGGKETRRHPVSSRSCDFSRDPSREPRPNFAAICDTCNKATSKVAAIYTLSRKSAANFAAICDTSRDARFSTRVIYTLSRKSACEFDRNSQHFAK